MYFEFVHGELGVRVDDLVSKGTWWQVGSLWDVEELVDVRTFEYSTSQRPQSTQYSEKRAFSASVGTSNKSVHAFGYFEGDLRYEYIPIG